MPTVRMIQGIFPSSARVFDRRCLLGPFLAISLLLGGCGSIVVPETQYKGMLTYRPDHVAKPVDAGNAKVYLTARHSMSPEVEKFWASWGNNQASINNYKQAVEQVELEDLKNSGLLANTYSQNMAGRGPEANTTDNADITILVQSEESRPAGYKLNVTLKVIDVPSQKELKAYTRESDLGGSSLSYVRHMRDALKADLAEMKASMAADFAGKNLRDLSAAAAALDPSDLDRLLVAKDTTITLARSRNRALVAAKTLTLPGILQKRKTPELVDLTVRIEQMILDVEHEAALAKDQAQSEAASGAGADRTREWSLVYKERIEILKPMLSATREEIANRSK